MPKEKQGTQRLTPSSNDRDQAEQLNRRLQKFRLQFLFMDGRVALPFFIAVHEAFMHSLQRKLSLAHLPGAAGAAAAAVNGDDGSSSADDDSDEEDEDDL
jgi:hypothetical protein